MRITRSKFIKSLVYLRDKPEETLPEIACVGRSNVGKSSLINTLTSRKRLAQVSKSPGKTKLINYFLINDSFYLVDLPGYGFAKVSHAERNLWRKMIENYLTKSEDLKLILVLTDLRIGPQKSDLQLIEWLSARKIPYEVIGTKADKLTKSQLKKNITTFYHKNPLIGKNMAAVSSVSKHGIEELLNQIGQTIESTPL